MIPALNAEFRKITTVRSTLFLTVISFLITSGLIGFWIYGFKDVGHAALNSGVAVDCIFAAVSGLSVFLSFIAILLVGHEYRYNTIMYSLTSVNQRGKVFFAKYVAVAAFTLVLSAVLILLTVVAFYIGLMAHHVAYATQDIAYWDVIWRSAAAILGSVTFAFIITMLIRSLTGSIATVIVLPSFVEGMLTLLLHDNVKYLPYTALSNLTQLNSKVSAGFSLVVVAVYALVLGIASYVLFLRRDAN